MAKGLPNAPDVEKFLPPEPDKVADTILSGIESASEKGQGFSKYDPLNIVSSAVNDGVRTLRSKGL